MNKALTWQQVLVVLLCIPLFAGLVMAFGGNIEPPVRRIGGYVLAVCVPLIAALVVWHLRKTRRPDLQPDVLATLVDPRAIFEVGGAAHVWLTHAQHGGTLVVMALLQNLFDAETSVEITMKAEKGGEHVGFVPTLSAVLAPSQVARAVLHLPLRPLARPSELKFALIASARTDGGRASRVRFGRRNVVSKKVNPALTGALLLAGTIHAGGGTLLTIPLAPFEPGPQSEYAAAAAAMRWDLDQVWAPGDPADEAWLAEQLQT